MMKTKLFKGVNVFMSRNLVAPEIFDALLDALKLNGAEIFLCCDPSRNGPNDFHVISSFEHEKFEDLQAKGCNMLGPQCVISCAKENRALPKQGFTCCLAMDGLRVLASGFDMDEKVKIGKLVTAMGGVLYNKASSDVSFVIVKNVLAAKYKWAFNMLKKPIVTISWLHQCWNEHRVVPQESYRVLPFSGLSICVTRIPAEERKTMEKFILQNGGKYSAELTKNCTHLITDTAQGDKYKVARKWGHIHIVSRKWFDQSIARRACLNEESYPVQGSSSSSSKCLKTYLASQQTHDRVSNSGPTPFSGVVESNLAAGPFAGFGDSDLEATLSQNMSSMFPDASTFVKEEEDEATTLEPINEINVDDCVANDSESEDNDLYLSECRIFLVGFESSEMRKLVNMVWRGGGSRYMSFNDKLTHMVVGTPSEVEKKEARSLAASGVIHVVKTNWLEDCNREKKEISVQRRHTALDLLLPKDSAYSAKGANTGMINTIQSKNLVVDQNIPSDLVPGSNNTTSGTPSLEKSREEKPELNMNCDSSQAAAESSKEKNNLPSFVNDKHKARQEKQRTSSFKNLQSRKSSVFRGKIFCFSDSFPEDRRAEVMQWVTEGGGQLVTDNVKHYVHFTIECHGVIPKSACVPQTTYVSSHWVRSCLEGGSLLDVDSHIIYSPLPCQIPLPGFERFRFCVSQYEEKDRLLLRNLCFVLGARFGETLTRKVTHLICKFTSGPKYDAACKWRICSVTSEWIYECVRQNQVISVNPFCPKEVTLQDQEAGFCTVTQFPTQAFQMVSGDNPSQLMSQSNGFSAPVPTLHGKDGSIMGSRNDSLQEEPRQSCGHVKKAKALADDHQQSTFLSSRVRLSDPSCDMTSSGNRISEDAAESAHVVPDVAAAIEDLLEQTSKIHDQNSPGRTRCEKTIFSSDAGIGQEHSEPHSVIGLSRHWLNRTVTNDDTESPSTDVNAGIYGGFSETQTDSQVVGYEEDLSGRQMLIDKVRTRSSLT